jgi:hypothetical protein
VGLVNSKGPGIVFDFQKTRDRNCARRKLRIREDAHRGEGILNTTFRLHFHNVADSGHHSSVLSAVYLAKRTVIPEYRRILQHGTNDLASVRLVSKHVWNVVKRMPQVLGFAIDWARRRVDHLSTPNASFSNWGGTTWPNGGDRRLSLSTEWGRRRFSISGIHRDLLRGASSRRFRATSQRRAPLRLRDGCRFERNKTGT